jgi:subtilisin family serine protease
MSFGLLKDQTDMRKAVLEAHAKSILMFAAASNKGGNFNVTYPAKYGEAICIFSTDGLGSDSIYNPTQMGGSGYHLATLGEGVKSAWPIDLQEGSNFERRMSGTSFATPIAAGVAACVLEFTLMNQKDNNLYEKLHRRDQMKEVFAQRLADNRNGWHYIRPWKLFDKERSEDTILTLIEEALEG